MSARIIPFPARFSPPPFARAYRADGMPVRPGDAVRIDITPTGQHRPRSVRGIVHSVFRDADNRCETYAVWCHDGINRHIPHHKIILSPTHPENMEA